MIDKIKPYLVDVGIRLPGIVFKKSKLINLGDEKLEEVLRWLASYHTVYCGGVDRAKGLVPQSVWDMYTALGTKDSYEQKQLGYAKQLLYKAWKDRPSALIRDRSKDGRKKGTRTTRRT